MGPEGETNTGFKGLRLSNAIFTQLRLCVCFMEQSAMLQQTELIFDFASDHHSMSQVSKYEAEMLDTNCESSDTDNPSHGICVPCSWEVTWTTL